MRQLILQLMLEHPPTLADFVVGPNAEALAALACWRGREAAEGGGEFAFFLWGDAGAGKTHLLRASAADDAHSDFSLIYHDARHDPGLAALDLPLDARRIRLLVDHVEHLDEAGQIALFHHFNRLRAGEDCSLLAAARQPPLRLKLREDLRTRLGSGLIYRLLPLSDDEKMNALKTQAAARGLELSEPALHYLLTRAPRDMPSLSALVAAIDHYSLERKRPVTLPLLREVLAPLFVQENR
ncbi:MAG: DnaA regulatory inactivator Hda [Betaproteobacteria bacterium]|nr:DnaA regulatory inactivator Hda [Betaproteobacteria bacterium]